MRSLKHLSVIVSVLIVLLAWPSPSQAQAQGQATPPTLAPSTSPWSFGLAATGSVILPFSLNGDPTVPLLGLGMAFITRHKAGLALSAEGAMVTPITSVQPSPQALFGMSWKLAERFALGVTGGLRYVPAYGQAQAAVIWSALLAPTVRFDSGHSLILPLGFGFNGYTGQVMPLLGLKFVANIL